MLLGGGGCSFGSVLALEQGVAEVAQSACFRGSNWTGNRVHLGQPLGGWAGQTDCASLQSYHNLCCDSISFLADFYIFILYHYMYF